MKLLVVDDSNVIRNKISRTIQLANVEVVGTARNGREAVQMFAKFRPELVTMDITMPEMDGIQCTREILKLRPDCLILVVSALADKATAIEALKAGAHGFRCKPFSDRELNEAVSELLRGAGHG
jgi:two-component system, chemotaxis family, chemotaxis protein CheY